MKIPPTIQDEWIFPPQKYILNEKNGNNFFNYHEIAINPILRVDKETEFCFLDFHKIIGLFSVNQKQNPHTLFLSFKLPQSASQKSSNFKGFCDFLTISD